MKNELKNILIVGANFSNKGAEAMLLTVTDQVSKRIENPNLYMICSKNEYNLAAQHGFTPIFIPPPNLKRRIYGFIWLNFKRFYKLILQKPYPYKDLMPMKQVKAIVSKPHIIINISGYAFGDFWGKGQIQEMLKLIRYGKKRGAKVYFMPQAWGPFNNRNVAENARKMLKLSDDFFARDETSQMYLTELLNLENEKVKIAPDIAFIFDNYNKEKGRSIINQLVKSDDDNILVGLSPNMRIYDKSDGQEEENVYVQLLIKIIKYLINKYSFKFILIPNEIKPNWNSRDDRYLCKIINQKVNHENCLYLEEYHSAEEVKSIIANTDMLIGSRYHTLIFSLSLGIPSLALSWSHKYVELFKYFGIEKFVLDYNDVNEEELFMILDSFVKEKISMQQKIFAKLPEINKNINRVFDIIFNN